MEVRLLILWSHVLKKLGDLPSVSGNHQPCGAVTTSGWAVGVTLALNFTLPRVFSRYTQSPLPMPSFSAVLSLISTTGNGSSSRSQGIIRCSEWKKTGERRPVVRISGYFLAKSGEATGLSFGSS